MRTAILSLLFVVISSAAPQQDPPQPASGHQPSQQKPSEQPLTVQCAAATTIQLGVPYNSQAIASGGSGAYQFAITGGALPAGIALNPATGAISGTPTADGTFSYTVQVTDSNGAMATTGGTPCTLQSPVAPAPAATAAPIRVPSRRPKVRGTTKPPAIAQPRRSPRSIRRSWQRRGIRRSGRPHRRFPRTIIRSFLELKTRSR